MGKSFSDSWVGGNKQWDSKVWDSKSYVSCYHSHPPLVLPRDGQKFQIYGGNCSTPVVKDADIYIGFNHGATNPSTVMPWEPEYKQVITLDYPVTDMCAPGDADKFKKLVEWTCNQLQSGKKIHAGCIGGHGRTGTFLAAVAKEFCGIEDAIAYVREAYCKKAVESESQIKFLVKHFGIKSAEARKYSTAPKSYPSYPSGKANGYQGSSGSSSKSSSVSFAGSKRTIAPVASVKSVW